jgi:NAD-dependent protein deacetylase/lipoamidase
MESNERILKDLISKAARLVAFTGAGISAESGIPTYRGDDGVWNKYDPAKYADIRYFRENPAYYWNFFKDIRCPVLKDAQPNRAHLALARLEASNKLAAVITQNIDGLHQLSGSKRVLELHGNTRRILCLECGEAYGMDTIYSKIETQLPPRCSKCNGILKPDVVFFGESLPATVLEEAVAESRECDLFMVVGSSLVVQPAASLPVMAKENGAKLVILNKDATPLDHMADLVIHDSASVILDQI